MKTILLSALVGFSAIALFGWKMADSNSPQTEAIKWMTVEQAYKQAQADVKAGKKAKKVFMDVYTDWCGWCKRMDAATFQDAKFAEYITANYYPVKFDAEQKEDINVNGKTYKAQQGPNGRKGTHEYAIELLSGQMSYPTVVFLDESYKLIQAVPGYREAPEMRKIASYFAGDFHKNTSWDQYQKNYKE